MPHLLHLRGIPAIETHLLLTPGTFLEAFRIGRNDYGRHLARIEYVERPWIDRTRLRILLEDLLVARQRFAWCRKRVATVKKARGLGNARSHSKAAVADMEAHRTTLFFWMGLLRAAGGEALCGPEDKKAATGIARDRLRDDMARGCLCGSKDCQQSLPAAEVEREQKRVARAIAARCKAA